MKKAIAWGVLGFGGVGLCVVAYVSAGAKGVLLLVGICAGVIALLLAIDVISF